jgi:hypothetical protein
VIDDKGGTDPLFEIATGDWEVAALRMHIKGRDAVWFRQSSSCCFLPVTYFTYFSVLKMEAAGTSET